MSELERVFRLLVNTLANLDPSWLHRPIPVGALSREIIPYRDVRDVLGLACNEDYESLLVRLCAGHEELAELTDPDVRERFIQEVASLHPDLDFLSRWADAEVALDAPAVARALGGPPPDDFAPAAADPEPPLGEPAPIPEPEPEPTESEPTSEEAQILDFPLTVTPASETAAPQCLFCGGELPVDREAKYCPHCGQGQAVLQCPGCNAELEAGWRHCISCGQPVPHF
ncbi:MAG: zinc ribbon domain-containing protein [Gemmatimonadales bacterium]|nr:zinc ribbon domain-containing protein [Gemmatimonadales bacterium]